MPAHLPRKVLRPRRAFYVVEFDVEEGDEARCSCGVPLGSWHSGPGPNCDGGPSPCCVDAQGNYAECERCEKERLSDSDGGLDAHLALARSAP